jgi:signal transduction histidine kinase
MRYFEDIKDYVGFTESDTERLEALYPVVEPHFTTTVDKFYDALERNEHTREVFEGPEQVERLRHSLHEWLDTVFSGPHDERYFNQRLRIGRQHVEVGLRPQYMFGAMNIVRIDLIDHLLNHDDLPVARGAAVESVERILDLELSIMLHSYWDAVVDEKTEAAAALASGLAHEIRNPLNAIGLNMTLLERRLSGEIDEDAFRPMLSSIRSELRRIEGLTKDIKDFAKPMDVQRTWHDVGEFFEDLEMVHGPTLDASDIAFSVDVDRPCPVYCDPDRLKQALVNLLKNAVEAIDTSGHIELAARCAGPRTVIELTDDGEGMQPTVTDQVFDLFYTTKPSGTGIGLPIVKKIIDAHRGSIDVTSSPGSGTTFRIVIPNPPQDDTDLGADHGQAHE